MLHQQLPNLYIFRLVSEMGSFQAAANELGISRSSVSKKVVQLENYLQQRLLQRSTRQIKLTEDGQALLTASAELDHLLTNTETLLQAKQKEPIGKVSISTSTLFGQLYLLPRIAELRQRFPKVQLQLNFDDQFVDLLEKGIDIAIRVGELPDSSMVAKKIGTKSWGCFASPDFIAGHGQPKTPAELPDFSCLLFRTDNGVMNHWSFADKNGDLITQELNEEIAVDDARALVDLACRGLGIIYGDAIAIQPELEQGKLVPILEDWQSKSHTPIHLLCLGRNTRSKAADAVWHTLAEWLKVDMNNKAK